MRGEKQPTSRSSGDLNSKNFSQTFENINKAHFENEQDSSKTVTVVDESATRLTCAY
jgi:hypothetical protein